MQRNKAIDISKGIAILLVIIGHQGDIPAISHFIYTFHMPLFFILGGYFFKVKDNKDEVKNDYKRLIKPYLFSCGLYLLWYVVFGLKYHSIDLMTRALECALFGSGAYHGEVIWSQFPTIGMIWFLLALFWCRLIYNYITQNFSKYKCCIAGSLAVTATLVDNYLINLPFAILPGLSAMMFYMLGNILREHSSKICCKQGILLPLGLTCWILSICYFGISMVNCKYHCYPVDVIGACFATWLIYKISLLLEKKTKYISAFLEWAGINSMTILCAHFLEQSTFVWQHVHIPETWYIILSIKLIYVIVFTMLAYRIPYTRNLLCVTKLSLK